MNIEKSFTFPFEDKEWTGKLGLGILIGLIPFLNFAWSGYMVGITRNVMENAREPLPNWDDLGKKFLDGLMLFGASIIYATPMLLLICLPLGMMASAGAFSSNSDLQDIARTIGEAGGVLFVCLSCVFLLYLIMWSILYPAIMVIFAREGTFAACFKIRAAVDMISRNAGPFFTTWAMGLVASLGVGFVVGMINMITSFIPCIGWVISVPLSLFASIYSTIVYAHLFGQFGRVVFGQVELASKL